MKYVFYSLTCFLFCITLGCAQNTITHFDENQLLERLKTLSSDEYEGRKTGKEGNEKGRQFIIEQFKSLGVSPFGSGYEHEFSFKRRDKEYKGKNVLAKIEGTKFPKTYIVISAHHDHLGISKDGKIYNGADDDASGIAALFAFAEYFKNNPPKHSVVLAAFDAEEMGLQGSKYFVEKMKGSDIMVNINMDMISRSAKNELYVVGTRYNEGLQKIISEFQNPTDSKLIVGHDGKDGKQDWTYSSDHGPFHREKIPFLYFGNEDHPAYHKPTDDFSDITPEFYKNAVSIIINVFKNIDQKGL